jgi:exosortase
MEPAGTERHRWAGRRPRGRERPSQTPHNLAILKYCQFALGADLLSSAPVQNLATPHRLTDASPLTVRHFQARFALSVLLLAALWVGLCRELSGEWSLNEQYNFGWFVPFFALYLFWLRWQDRPAGEVRGQKSEVRSQTLIAAAIAIISLFLLLPVRLFEIANPEWRLLAWIHALAVVTLTLLLLWWAGGKAWLRHFAFPVAFLFVAVPWPTMLETPVIQGLMRVVARVAAEAAMLLGTPAQVEGNLIRVTNGLVGVNEACSGIRSLQTSLMIGLLFGELKRLSVLRRVALVACAVAIALLANFVRAVFLVRIAATENLSEVGRWHDIAGYSIIALVFLATMAIAYFLGRRKTNNSVGAGVPAKPKPGEGWSPAKMQLQPARHGTSPSDWRTRLPLQLPAFYLAAALCWLLFVEIGTASWYRLHERNLISGVRWSVRWPKQAPNFRKLKIDEEIRAVLRFDKGEAAAWNIQNRAEASPIACSLFAFRWNPGRNSALLANLHRPDVCLPASGWKQMADHGVRSYPISDSVEMPFRHFEFQRSFEGSAPQTAHAFYCLSEDRSGEASTSLAGADSPGMFGNRSEWTRSERLHAVLEGRRHLGQQVIEAIFITNEPLSAADAESHLRDLVRDVVVLRERNLTTNAHE